MRYITYKREQHNPTTKSLFIYIIRFNNALKEEAGCEDVNAFNLKQNLSMFIDPWQNFPLKIRF
jgi:hypothetical protein